VSACERVTRKFPDGRTGTRAGYQAHRDASEQPCRPCVEANSAWSLARRRALPPDELERYRRSNVEATRQRAARNPEKRRAELENFRIANRAILRAAKDRPCADCQVSYPYYVMQFDHRDAAEKSFNVGNFGPTCSREKLLAEIAKCDVVCANCHAERTYKRSQCAQSEVA